ncbi:MAG: lipoyl(octanoyl) transferase LipB, partial [Rubrivivax sp.]|nr:lipoyl(octanoyl) transferase LipB [Rubrivivax sp.]
MRTMNLGRRPYADVEAAMRAFTAARNAGTEDELWLVEHEPVYTQGVAGKDEHVRAAGDIPVVRTERGGQVTYHGPGQVVAYPLVDLRRLSIYVKEYVFRIEAALIDTLA